MALPSMTYLDIVNRAVKESKISLDELTADNFAAPPRTIMYDRFKDWINDAYTELMEDKPEWFFRKERALVTIYPRIFLTDVADTIAVGDVLIGDTSEVELTVVGVYTFEEVEGNNESEVTVEFEATIPEHINDMVRGETFSRTSPTETDAIAVLAGVGRYTFENYVSVLDQIDDNSLRVHPLIDGAVPNYGTLNNNQFPIQVVPYYGWVPQYDYSPWTSGYPTYITQTDQGTYGLYPQPSEAMMLSFNYTRQITEMEAFDDVPEALPAKYHMYLVWRAVEEFADFDSNQSLWKRARKHLVKFDHYLFRDKLPQMGWGPSLFNRG